MSRIGTPEVTLLEAPSYGALSVSPYCNKVAFALRIKGLAYRRKSTLSPRRASATGKVPVLGWDGVQVHDSTEILRFLDRHRPSPGFIPTSRADSARAHLIEEWADEGLVPVFEVARAIDPAGMARLVAISLPWLPSFLLPLVVAGGRRSTLGRYRDQMVLGREIREAQIARHFDALDALADGREWLVGETISCADLAVAGAISAMRLGAPLAPLAELAARPNASAWLDRVLGLARVEPFRDWSHDAAAGAT